MTRAEKLAITKQWADLKYREEKSIILSKQNIERNKKSRLTMAVVNQQQN